MKLSIRTDEVLLLELSERQFGNFYGGGLTLVNSFDIIFSFLISLTTSQHCFFKL